MRATENTDNARNTAIAYDAVSDKPPVIMVHGLIGWGRGELLLLRDLCYWGTALENETDTSGLLVLEASVGPISSQHDRACELFARVKGRLVDYGEGHSQREGHNRWGIDYTKSGLYPAWDAAHPVHLVCHSAGGNTARQMQQLLHEDYWQLGTNADWVLSISCIASPLNGSHLGYAYVYDIKDGSLMLNARILAMGCWLLGGHRYLKLGHWGVKESDFRSVKHLNERLRRINFITACDNLGYDLSVHACSLANTNQLMDFPNTFYFSYVTRSTELSANGAVRPKHCSRLLLMSSQLLCSLHLNSLPPPYDSKDPEWCLNDGLVPVASQRYPLLGKRIIGGRMTSVNVDESKLLPGRWYYQFASELAETPDKGWDHLDPTGARGFVGEVLLNSLLPWRTRSAESKPTDERAVSKPMVTREDQRRFYVNLFRRISRLRR